MTSRRSTNVLLLIIALLLGAIALQLGSRPFIGDAVAKDPMTFTGVVGCFRPTASFPCEFRELAVDSLGRLLVSPGM